ncbi:high-affinity nicotinic acid transporter [Verticillium alfalfae VaMs.102]|uniref:High-affinity nicotinic acid transporter n=1 Tax=Verticillium alfalfae (strain VaMs.102 / ATCC MYA-4576 / FGSC 10136) TaxID=526221 RepID=C9S805_VERA1|nr:high-affinity nicotinic acid transporter [Verticillium alfalfae VaMs.102]EEY15295.1 high-affinity nicotinic acid transporter [Verticillium alfalfae VaMs.102]
MGELQSTTVVADEKASNLDASSIDSGAVANPQVVETIFIDPDEEKAVLRKFDKWVLPQAFVFILLNYLDRSNLGNARVFGFEEDIGLVDNQFGNLVTLFFVPYIITEVFWVTAVKRFGPNYVITVALFGWCIATIATGFVQNYGQALACRMLLGLFEAGVAPAFTFIFSTIYDRESTAKRVALINLANATSGAFGGMFAYAIQTMGTRRGLEAWRWLFIIEGSISLAICGGCLWSFPNKPETAWFLNEDEKALIVAIFGYGTFLPTLIRGFGYNAFEANYLTIPVYALGAISLATQAYWSDRLKKRALFLLVSACPVIAAYLICIGTPNRVAGYVAMFILVTGVYSFSCLMMTWVATNLVPDYKRSVGLPIFASIGNCSGLVAGQLYPKSQSPRYVVGNSISAGLEAVAAIFVALTWLLLRRRNQQKDKLIAEGATSNGMEGDRGLDFKYDL